MKRKLSLFGLILAGVLVMAGAGVVVASGLYLLWKEMRRQA